MMMAMSLNALGNAGTPVTPQDMSPRFAGTLFGKFFFFAFKGLSHEGDCSVRSILYWKRYLVPLPLNKMGSFYVSGETAHLPLP